LTKHHNFFENSHSKDKGEAVVNKVLFTETLQNTIHAGKERLRTLNSFFNKNENDTLLFKHMMTETGTINNKNFKLSDIKKIPLKFLDINKKRKHSTKKESYIFQIENAKLMKEKIFKFCKVNKIKIIEVSIIK